MENFKVKITSGKTFSSIAENINAKDLAQLSANIANFTKDTIKLVDGLKSKNLKGLQSLTIGKGTTVNIVITYTEDNTSLIVSIKGFGTFVRNNEVEQITEVINNIAEYQQSYGHLFANVK